METATLNLSKIERELTAPFEGITHQAQAILRPDSRGLFLGIQLLCFYSVKPLEMRFYVSMSEISNAEDANVTVISTIQKHVADLLELVHNANTQNTDPVLLRKDGE